MKILVLAATVRSLRRRRRRGQLNTGITRSVLRSVGESRRLLDDGTGRSAAFDGGSSRAVTAPWYFGADLVVAAGGRGFPGSRARWPTAPIVPADVRPPG